MSLATLMKTGLPLNRKERFYTGTVFPAVVCAEDFAHFNRLLSLIDGCPALEIDARPDTANVQVFTEYGLWESVFGDETRARFPTLPEARDTPDVLIYVNADAPVLIALEAKMYDRPTKAALEEQMRRQRRIVLDYLAPVLAVQPDRVFHICLLPDQLFNGPDYEGSFASPVLTWQSLYKEFKRDRAEDYWLGVLRLALKCYETLVSHASPRREHADDVLTGTEIVDGVKADSFGFKVMGRNFGLRGDPLRQDLESGRWRKQKYEVSQAAEPHNANWFLVSEFVSLVSAFEEVLERRSEPTSPPADPDAS